MGRKVALLMANMVDIVKSLAPAANANIPPLRSGDVVRVHARIVEGERERIQVFQGTVIRNINRGISASFTVRRIASNGIGVERTFLMLSPRIEKVEVMRHSSVRRAKLYFLRETTGKASRLKESRQDTK
jgi:large subunit ribosomal protein L19